MAAENSALPSQEYITFKKHWNRNILVLASFQDGRHKIKTGHSFSESDIDSATALTDSVSSFTEGSVRL